MTQAIFEFLRQTLCKASTLSTRDAMIVGTAGLTAMLSVMELEAQGTAPDAAGVRRSRRTWEQKWSLFLFRRWWRQINTA